MTGSELDCLGDGELADKISEIRVFARVSPDHKVRIVRALKKKRRNRGDDRGWSQ